MYELFEQKYRECEKALFLVALGYLHNTEEAKDCVQDAAYAALKSFGRLKNADYFKTWITRIVINKSKDYLRKKRYSLELCDNLNVFSSLPTEETEIMDCILRLDQKLSVYITLRFYCEMTYDEAAEILRQPVSTVKYRTKKALFELKKHLEGEISNEYV